MGRWRATRGGLAIAVWVLGLCVVRADAPPAAPGAKAVSHSWVCTVDAQITNTADDGRQQVQALTVCAYTWTQQGAERTLQLNRLATKTVADGQPTTEATMSLAGGTLVSNGQTKDIPFDRASSNLQGILRDTYGAPLCVLQVDAQGAEIKRTMVDKPGAADVVKKGVAGHAILFHAPYFATQATWPAARAFSLGNGGFATGTLTYKKLAAAANGRQPVQVSGVLTCAEHASSEYPATMKNVRYEVAGEQLYDPAQHEWVSGKLTCKVTYVLELDGRPMCNAAGTVTATLEPAPAPAGAPAPVPAKPTPAKP